ncbi:ribosome biogenesis GTPase Der [Alkalibacter rhizosphaerae]|uniref:GTPase Der n=1 Tax=Alkalibacter rhizosphaerae TaxID=2815577 RepID=A0A974XHH7_9FIRM|nr:ribosome biogenesis GTPase Der [Alkalibacter rhizosphaerae]QSX08765.1 ribosome biogenesis GTPase Der [Alkalibacter rhizosphaerae]
MVKPIVAVVGRPNVGKSTLFNKIAGSRISIVEDTPGVTRDRIYADCEWIGKPFTLIDTGGIEPHSNDIILAQMRRQAQLAIDTADVIVFIVDGREGMTAADLDVANMIRKSMRPIVLVVNKVENKEIENNLYEFYNLGLGDPMPISAEQALGLGDMLDRVVENFPRTAGDGDEDTRLKIAVLGKPNAGKSTLVNRLIGEERVIVSDVPGTTRDAIDTPFQYYGEEYVLTDTAGLRRKSKVYDDIERYSIVRSVAAVDRSDVCLILIDANDGISEQDAKIAGIAHNRGKASVIVVNKWDAYEAKNQGSQKKFESDVRSTLSFMAYAPIIFISAKTGQRLNKVMETILLVSNEYAKRITTGTLNEVIGEAVLMNQPPSDKGRRLKIYYATQGAIKPPTFIIFVNDKRLLHFSYERFLENQIRQAFGFIGTPIHLIIRERKEKA